MRHSCSQAAHRGVQLVEQLVLTSYILHPTSYILHPTSYVLALASSLLNSWLISALEAASLRASTPYEHMVRV